MNRWCDVLGTSVAVLIAGCAPPPCPASAPEPVPTPREPVTPPDPAPAAAPAPAVAPVPEPDAKSFAEGQQQIVKRAAETQFHPCPPVVPFECEIAVLEGSPQETGLFTVRFRSKKPWLMPPHTHPRAERVTVIGGTLSVGFGTTLDKAKGQQFSAGDYYVNAAGATHYVWADEAMEIQITGMGPWEVHPHRE